MNTWLFEIHKYCSQRCLFISYYIIVSTWIDVDSRIVFKHSIVTTAYSTSLYISQYLMSTVPGAAERVEPLNALNMKARRVLKGHQGKVLAMDWSRVDPRRLISASYVCLPSSGLMSPLWLAPPPQSANFVLCDTVFPMQDGRLIIWDAFSSSKDHVLPIAATWQMACAFSPSSTLVASGFDCRPSEPFSFAFSLFMFYYCVVASTTSVWCMPCRLQAAAHSTRSAQWRSTPAMCLPASFYIQTTRWTLYFWSPSFPDMSYL